MTAGALYIRPDGGGGVMTQGSSVKFETAALQKLVGCDMHAVAEETDMTPQETFSQRIWVGMAGGGGGGCQVIFCTQVLQNVLLLIALIRKTNT